MHYSLWKNPGVDKGPQPLMSNPALTTCASERMKTFRFSHFSDFAARKRVCVLGKICYLKKVRLDFFDTMQCPYPILDMGIISYV